MDLSEFTDTLAHMTADEIHVVAAALALRHATPAGDVDWWEATIAIERTLKVTHRTRAASMAALAASRAVQHAALANGVALPDDEVTAVARAAGEVARGLAAASDDDRALQVLLSSWSPLVASAA
jgi:hypothetical protein